MGHVNRSLLHILEGKAARLRSQYDVALRVVLACDSSGVAVEPTGFDPATLRGFKESGGKVSQLSHFLPGRTALSVVAEHPCDLIFEATPVNLQTGEPGLSIVRTALQAGVAVVLAFADLYGTLYHKIWETDALPTAAAMLHDALNLQQAPWR